MNTLNDLFTDFGGPAKVGQAIGVSTEHAAAMKRRRSIPSRYWLALVSSAQSHGLELSVEQIARLHAEQPQEAQ
jgi:hypothetical protein